MIAIRKNREPHELEKYRQMEGASYQDMHGAPTGRIKQNGEAEDVYEVVLNALAAEQGNLCAYCMRRIPQKKVYPQMTIEHILPQSETSESKRMDYRNMLAVCNGNRNATSNKDKTCDARRGSLPEEQQKLTVNPLIPSTLKSIKYRTDGTIFSEDPEIDKDLNVTLNLNCSALLLPDCRKSALHTLQAKVNKENCGKTASKEYFQKLLKQCQQRKGPYVGILLDWLEGKV